MRKMLLFTLMFSVLFLTQMMPTTLACHKYLISIDDEDGDGRVEVGEIVEFRMRIGISAYLGSDWFDIVVKDRIAAELDIVPDSIDASQGSVTYDHLGNKKKGATLLVWDVGDLMAYQPAELFFTVRTGTNPAGKQEYTSPGYYELNSGPTLKCMMDGHQYSEDLNTISIYVYWPD